MAAGSPVAADAEPDPASDATVVDTSVGPSVGAVRVADQLTSDVGPGPPDEQRPDDRSDLDDADRHLQAAFAEPPRGIAAAVEPWVGGLLARPGTSLAGVGAVVAFGLLGFLLLRGSPPPPPDPSIPMTTAPSGVVGAVGEQAAATGSVTPDADAPPPTDDAAPRDTTSDPVVAHVAGAVHRPGLHVVGVDARVADLIEAAGGARPDADLDRLNLAAPVPDGARIYVPAVGQLELPLEIPPSLSPGSGPVGSPPGDVGGAVGSGPAPVAVNVADAAELERLPGVGPATANAIIEHRERNGPFTAVEDLLAVRGIGEAKLAALRDHVVL